MMIRPYGAPWRLLALVAIVLPGVLGVDRRSAVGGPFVGEVHTGELAVVSDSGSVVGASSAEHFSLVLA